MSVTNMAAQLALCRHHAAKRLRVLAVLLAALLIPNLAFAETTITVWHFFGGGVELETFLTLVDRFMKEHPDIQVETVAVPWGDPYYEKLSVAVVANSAPDVALMHATKIAEFIEGEFLRELTPDELNAAGIYAEDYFPVPWQASTYDGKVYAIPFDIHPIGLYINRQLLEEAGVAPTPPATGEELLETARFLNRDQDGDGMLDVAGFGIRDDGYTFYRMWYSIVHQFGLEILDEARTGLNPDPRLVEAFDTLVDAKNLGALTVGGVGADFIGGNVAFFVEGTWVIGDYNRYGLNYTAAPFPVFGERPATWTDSHLFVLPYQAHPDEERLEASKTFVKWMSHNNGIWSAAAGHVSPSRQVLQTAEFQALEPQMAFARQLDYVVFFPQVRGAWTLQGSLAANLHRIMSGDVTNLQGFENIKTEFANVLTQAQ